MGSHGATSSFVIAVLACSAPAAGQCTSQWTSCLPLGGTNDEVREAAWWDPDGPGPLGPRIVLAGLFTAAGTTLANRVCAYDPATGGWHAFGSGLDLGSEIHAIAGLPNGDLVVGGRFASIGGVPASNVARWNGSSWQAMGTGLPAPGASWGAYVGGLAVRPNGELVAGGAFTIGGTTVVDHLAVWTGTQWVPLPGGSVNGPVASIVAMPNGDVTVLGAFTSAGGASADRLARWNGATWTAIVGGPPAGAVLTCLAASPNGDVLVGGSVPNPPLGHDNHVWRSNGAAWSTPWSAPSLWVPSVRALTATSSGGFAVGGSANGVSTLYRSVAGISSTVSLPGWSTQCLLALPNDEVIVGGDNTLPAPAHVFRWDASGVVPLGPATDGRVRFANEDRNGDLIAAGDFQVLGGVAASRVARATSAGWTPMGSGADGPIAAGARLVDGALVLGGSFTHVAGVPAANLARWDGASWSPLGAPNGLVDFVHALPDGGCVVAGSFTSIGGVAATGIARWDGAAWHAYGSGLYAPVAWMPLQVRAVVPRSNGGLLVVGEFALSPGGGQATVASWDGSQWIAVLTAFHCLTAAPLPNGDVAIGGSFTPSPMLPHGFLVRWDGTAMHAFGAPDATVFAMATLANGDLVVAGAFTQLAGSPVQQVARWNGATWSQVANGLGITPSQLFPGGAGLQRTADGELLLHGAFAAVDGITCHGLAQLTPTCPATAVPFGAGCAGSGGLNVLTPTELPWLGARFAATATGLAPSSLAVLVAGATTAAVPMGSILPVGGTGCTLHVTPDTVLALLPAGNAATFGFAIPALPVLVGGGLHLQVAPLELDVTGAIVALTGTNALTLTVGLP